MALKEKNLNYLLVDDHPMFRKGLSEMIKQIDSDAHFFEACSKQEVLEIMAQHEVDIIFLDVNLTDGTGLELLKESPDLVSKAKVILLTMYNDKMIIKEAFELGAHAYLSKETADEELVVCLRLIKQDMRYLNESALESFSHVPNLSLGIESCLDNLTKTERAVLIGVSESLSSKDIAEKLRISHRTVENHRTNICNKLGLKGVNALTRFVLENKNQFS
ncbi:response regulator transcription factor [bacterium]|nr:MAG: response regulator transcription factor [bacterium]